MILDRYPEISWKNKDISRASRSGGFFGNAIAAVEEYEMFKLIDALKKTKEGEFRKGVCLRVTYKWQEVQINLDKLKDYAQLLERFINYTKLYLASK